MNPGSNLTRLLILIAIGFSASQNLFSSKAFAALGGTDESVQADMKSMNLTRTISQHSNYSRHDLSTKSLLVHEFMGSDGKVFALAWSGSSHPDLSVVMGAHFSDFQKALTQARQNHRGRRPINIDSGNFHLEMSGHMGALQGRAWLTSQIPQGVNRSDLQ
jgi:hypothetical protein